MSNYLKKFLFAVLILMMPYMNSAPKAMDDGDYEGSFVRVHQVSLMTDDQKDVSSSVKQSTSSQVVSSEDSKVSWTSYLLSPVKSVIQSTTEIMDFATQSPQKALFVGLCLAYQVAAVVADNCSACAICQCSCINPGNGRNESVGKSPNILTCIDVCKAMTNQWGQYKFKACI